MSASRVSARSPGSRPMRQRRMRWRSCKQLVQRLRRDGARIVRLALRFLNDHLELARQLVGVDQRAGVRVGLHVESLRKAGRRQHRVVARVIVDRGGVEIAADGLRLFGDLADAARRRALEVHVLEHVRDADDVVGLVEVARADVRDDGDDGRRAVAANENGQAVRKTSPNDRRRIDRDGRIRNWHEQVRRGSVVWPSVSAKDNQSKHEPCQARRKDYRGMTPGAPRPAAPCAGAGVQFDHGPGPARLRKFVASAARLRRMSVQPR